MKIQNNTNLITTEQIKECISLLGREYIELEDEVIIYSESPDTSDPYGLYTMSGSVSLGRYEAHFTVYPDGEVESPKPGKIEIYTDKIKRIYKSEDDFKIHFIGSLIHEIRHAHQRITSPEKLCDYFDKPMPYEQRWSEIDAMEFTDNMMVKLKDMLKRILNINKDEWDYDARKPISIW